MRVNFLSNNDITGGNSGSPVLNAHAELVGSHSTATGSSLSGDILFNPDMQRTISVDILYVLYVDRQGDGGSMGYRGVESGGVGEAKVFGPAVEDNGRT